MVKNVELLGGRYIPLNLVSNPVICEGWHLHYAMGTITSVSPLPGEDVLVLVFEDEEDAEGDPVVKIFRPLETFKVTFN